MVTRKKRGKGEIMNDGKMENGYDSKVEGGDERRRKKGGMGKLTTERRKKERYDSKIEE